MENSAQMEQAIAALRQAYVAFNRGDIDAVTAVMDPQIEWSEPNDHEHLAMFAIGVQKWSDGTEAW